MQWEYDQARQESFGRGEKHEALTADDLRGIVLSYAPVRQIIAETGSEVETDQDGQVSQLYISCGEAPWLVYKLRDRRSDGPRWSPSRLVDWNYGGNADVFILGRAIEESTYWLDPRYPLEDIYTPQEASFIKNPFDALFSLGETQEDFLDWLDLYRQVAERPDALFPGYFARQKIPGLRRHILTESTKVLKARGYTHLTAVPTWYHIAELYESLGFRYVYEQDKKDIELLSGVLGKSERTKAQESWRVMLQFWIHEAYARGIEVSQYVRPEEVLETGGKHLMYPLSPEKNIWMYQKLD